MNAFRSPFLLFFKLLKFKSLIINLNSSLFSLDWSLLFTTFFNGNFLLPIHFYFFSCMFSWRLNFELIPVMASTSFIASTFLFWNQIRFKSLYICFISNIIISTFVFARGQQEICWNMMWIIIQSSLKI